MKLLLFLQELERALPPGANRHHSVTACLFGPQCEGRLGLHVWTHPNKSTAQTFYLDDADKKKEVDVLVAEIVQTVTADDNTSL